MIKKALPIIISLVIAGCVSIPELNTPSIEEQVTINKNNTNYIIKRSQWWTELNDPHLNQLMSIVLENNKDLKLAAIKIDKIKEQYNLNNANKNIAVDFEATAKKQRLSGNSFNPPEYSNRLIDNDSLSLNTSYDLDIFDKTKHTGNQYLLLAQAETLNTQMTELALSNQIVKLYAQINYIDNDLVILKQQRKIATQVLNLEKYKLTIGKGIKDSILSKENNLNEINTEISNSLTNRKLAISAILEMSNNNNKISRLIENNQNSILKNDINIPKTYSAEIIAERPDVKYYLYTIESQSEKLKALKADFYPNITISGSLGFETITPNLLLSKSSMFATLAPTIKLPIFDSGKIKSNYKIAGYDLSTFIENYNQTLTKSIQNINDNLHKLNQTETALNNSQLQLNNDNTIYENMNTRYQLGTLSNYDLIIERNKLLSQQRLTNKNSFTKFTQKIDVINSLGGINITNKKSGA